MTVLLCDDHDLFVTTLADALHDAGHDVAATVSDPDTLAATVAALHPDICLVDVSFDGVLRLDAAIGVREHSPETIVVLLTATNDESMWAALRAGLVQGIVGKRCGLRELDTVIRSALGGRRTVAGVIPPQRRPQPDVRLTSREVEVLRCLDRGLATEDIALRIGVSVHTVRAHVQALLQKLHATNRLQAVRQARRLGLLGGELPARV